jgi:hypothetical protein
MFKTLAKLEHKVGERIYQFACDGDAPLGEVHDALARFKGHLVDLISTADKAERNAAPKVEPKPE